MPYQMADLALLGADKKRLSHRWASSLAVSLALSIVFFADGGKLLYINARRQDAYSYFDVERTGSFRTAGGICSLT